MQVVTFTEARSRRKDVLDDVNDNVETTIISRRNGGDAVVMLLTALQLDDGNHPSDEFACQCQSTDGVNRTGQHRKNHAEGFDR